VSIEKKMHSTEHCEEGKLLEHLGVGGRILLKWILYKFESGLWIGLILLRTGTSGGLF
jgi:hypothetical protein